MAVSRKVKPTNLDVQIWAQTGSTQFPTQIKYDAGWNFEVPIDEEENYIQNQQDQAIANINQQGVADYDATTTYWINSWVTYDDGVDVLKYISLQDSHVGNTPDPVGNAFWVRLDRFESTAQTFADSRLEFVSLSVSSLVAAVDLNNVTDLNGDDPALETLAAKIGNESGFVKANQLLKTDATGVTRVNAVLAGSANYSTTAVFASSAIPSPSVSTGVVSANSSVGLTLTGNGTFADVILYNRSSEAAFRVRPDSRDCEFNGVGIYETAASVSVPSGETGQVWGATNGGLTMAGFGVQYDFNIRNRNLDQVLRNPTNSKNVEFLGTSIYSATTIQNPTTSTGVVQASGTNGLVLSGFGASNDVTLRNQSGTSVAYIPNNAVNLWSVAAISLPSNSKIFANTEFVHQLLDSTKPTHNQILYNDGAGAAPVQTFAITTFTLGPTGNALIEATWELRASSAASANLNFIVSASGTTTHHQNLVGVSGNFFTFNVQHSVSGSAFASIAGAFTQISLFSGAVDDIELIAKNYKVTPY